MSLTCVPGWTAHPRKLSKKSSTWVEGDKQETLALDRPASHLTQACEVAWTKRVITRCSDTHPKVVHGTSKVDWRQVSGMHELQI